MRSFSINVLETIIRKSGIGILIIDQEETISLVNQWFLKYALLQEIDVCEKNFIQVFPELKGTRLHRSIQLCLEDRQYSILTQTLNPFPFPLFESRKNQIDNKRIHQFIHIIPIPIENSEETLAMVQISDVTQQVVRESMLREQMNVATQLKEAAIQASHAKSLFLASMSHEIRTPLNSILGMTEVLEETRLDSDQKKYLEVLRNSGKALFNLINDILDLSRIEAGKIEIENHPFSLKNVIEETLSLFYLRAKNKGVALQSSIFPGLATSIYGDPIRLQQILINLLGNAVKFTNEGHINLSISHTVDIVEHKEMLLIEVEDTGIGIPESKLQSIFDSFTQVDNSNTRKFGGTGLGLTISKKLAELMSGKLSVESREGVGSKFKVILPYNPYHEQEELKRDHWEDLELPDPEHFPKLKILLAEDSPENVFLVQTLVRKYPIEIEVAENGKVAFDKVIQSKFDLVLMDVQMPIMDGNESITKIRHYESSHSISEAKALPIIALTANVSKEDIKASFEAGCNSYLTKPVRKSDLLKLIYYYGKDPDNLFPFKS
ncbi:PAS domain S-box protein [Leptospira ryugenii]|uniref:Sensory/regulatory protein RpfC n=1 Tax=Leptospira ryugenii TaxID=1917863 RepID=A0A2P2E3N0_9LEPT|nr:ATP-binding protein [Leptospira ryugenii]GBF51500.1 PAS domain S-box protein [Leptospira ryugenii]